MNCISDEFGSLTNEILRQSNFYINHNFITNENQQNSAFNKFLVSTVKKQTQIFLIAYISESQDDEICSITTLDFAQRIR